jgi:hypothetical protein
MGDEVRDITTETIPDCFFARDRAAEEHGGYLLAGVIIGGPFVVVLSSSVTGEIARRPVRGRMLAFAEAVRMLRERAAAEASNNPPPMHGEVIIGPSN